MDINSLLQRSAQLFKEQLDTDRDGKVETSEIVGALAKLFGNTQGQLNLASIISSMQNGGSQDLMQLASSWLGKGQNAPVSGNQLEQIFGHDKIAAFAKQLGISESSALNGLQEAVPNVIDKASPNGTLADLGEQLLNSVGGVSGAINAFGKMFGRKP
ncbi:YidB family protein [Methylotuvimicrobium sp. KM2]|uniref:YidB family protein n=1 Tax=Methylotuvimicrobium sp. KM2 TaxID=3133976 RepID=UPI003100EF16